MKQKHSDKAKNIKLLYLVNGGAMMKDRAYEVKILAIISLKTVAVGHNNNNREGCNLSRNSHSVSTTAAPW